MPAHDSDIQKSKWDCSWCHFEVSLSFPQELISLDDHLHHIFLSENSIHSIVSLDSLIKLIKKPAVEFRIEKAGYNELLAEGCMHSTVLAEAKAFLIKQRLGCIKHRIVSSACRKIYIAFSEKAPRGMNCSRSLVQELARFVFHARIASSFALTRNGLSPPDQTGSETKARLILTPYFSESSEIR